MILSLSLSFFWSAEREDGSYPGLGEGEGGGGNEGAAWRKRKVRYRRNKKNRAKKLKLTLESNVVSGSRMPRVKIKECRARARELASGFAS